MSADFKKVICLSVALMTAAGLFAASYYRVEKRADGKWWAVDSSGRPTTIRGVDWIIYSGHRCEVSGRRRFYREWNDLHYPTVTAWAEETASRLKDWGFNFLGNAAETNLYGRGFAYASELNIGNTFGKLNDWTDPRWIVPQRGAPCTALPDVFHPDFREWADEVAAKRCAPQKEDPDLLGYFIDNELAWWGIGGGTHADGIYAAVTNRPPEYPVHRELVRFLAGREVTPELKRGFLRHIAERYFEVTAGAIRRADPNHMVLGCRFAGLGGAVREVWEAAGKYCDLLTFNVYPYADLPANEMRVSKEDTKPLADHIRERYEWAGRPLMVTEWSFPAIDSGLPCSRGAGQRFLTQKERAAATELCAKTFLSLDCVVGYDYFMWVDEPAMGIARSFPENTNYGLVNEHGVPYAEVTEVFRRLHGELEKWRGAPLPAKRKPSAEEVAAAAEREREVQIRLEAADRAIRAIYATRPEYPAVPVRAEWAVTQEESSETIGDWVGKTAFRSRPDDEEVEVPRNLRIFLLVGQSNMAGRGVIPPDATGTVARAYKMTPEGKWVKGRSPWHYDKASAGYGIVDTFVKRYLEEHPGDSVGIIPCAIGGTPSSSWSPEVSPISPFIGTNYFQSVTRTKKAMERGTLCGILWHQGESDRSWCAKSSENGRRYAARLTAIANSFRRDLDAPRVPFLIGEIGRLPNGSSVVMNPLLAKAAAKTPDALLVKAEDMTGYHEDGMKVHFDTAGYRELGIRYYEAWKLLAE